MTLEEKVAQLASIWLGDQPRRQQRRAAAGRVRDPDAPFAELIRDGLGQLTRVFGTRPVPPADGVRTLRDLQAQVVAASRFGIPAIAHEECLTGFAAWTATIFPTPLAWGASFDPSWSATWPRPSAPACGRSASTRAWRPCSTWPATPAGDGPRRPSARTRTWSASVGTAYVRGLQSAGVHATLKHFAGYSASRAGRNLAPVAIGRRELADVILPPFEMAIRGGARSVMPPTPRSTASRPSPTPTC